MESGFGQQQRLAPIHLMVDFRKVIPSRYEDGSGTNVSRFAGDEIAAHNTATIEVKKAAATLE